MMNPFPTQDKVVNSWTGMELPLDAEVAETKGSLEMLDAEEEDAPLLSNNCWSCRDLVYGSGLARSPNPCSWQQPGIGFVSSCG